MEMKEQTGSMKKLLAPVAVILLCLVALTGAAYAYNSTVTVYGNGMTGDQFVLEVYDNANDPALVSEPISIKSMDLYTVTSINHPTTGDTVTVKAETIANSYVGKLTLKDSDVGTATVARTITATATPSSSSIDYSEVTGAASGSITYSIAVTLYSDSTCQTSYNASSVSFTNGVAELYYKIVITAGGDGIVFNNATPQADVDLVVAQLANETYVLTFTATAA